MFFGGLEVVAGGYLIHRHYKHKNKKKRQETEVEARRHHTFPGAKPSGQQCQQHSQPQPQHQHSWSPQPDLVHGPEPPKHAQTFTIPRRPIPERKPQIIIEPSLQRTDSFATLSRMPIANGYRPQDVSEDTPPVLPPRRHATSGLSPATTQGVYGNAGYSVSTPALGATPTSPALTYTMVTGQNGFSAHSTDDNWETYDHHVSERPVCAPTEASTQLGERDPPPPYTP
ncbi:hypothetical protein BDU57DRAFT_586380 [Ampelomyces quisqualis]|uniref:Uncharacterized protein n=1 Tax=Ampelomyces quisqualis TaxID=50730 RepID=A0A6A5QSG9_AMPQU|nr:hypothetical protein BDU57DRAFT_586380 [Ampelomyces quisqualis]